MAGLHKHTNIERDIQGEDEGSVTVEGVAQIGFKMGNRPNQVKLR